MVEHRRSRRVLPVEPLLAKVGAVRSARVVDLSVHGVQLEAPSGLRPDSVCSVSLATGSGQVQVRARVRRCRAVRGASHDGLFFNAGLEFVELDPAQVEAIEDLIVDLCLTEVVAPLAISPSRESSATR